jgi:hypothetical protein
MKTIWIAWIIIIIGFILVCISLMMWNSIEFYFNIDLTDYGGFIGGTVGALFSLSGFLLIYETLKINKIKQFEDNFFSRFKFFHEFRMNQIALNYTKGGIECTERGTDFFDYIFNKQLSLEIGKKVSLDYYTKHLKIHKYQFYYYFSFFELCLSSINESSLKQKQKQSYYSYLSNLLTQQEQFVFSIYEVIVEEKNFPLIKIFKNRFNDLRSKTITQT